jgi:hypothetical protein
MLRMNKTVRTTLRAAFQKQLDQGYFPEVGWKRGAVFNYNTHEYVMVWGRMAHLVDQALKRRGYNMGCYECRRSDDFRAEVFQIIGAIKPQDVEACDRMVGVPG